jgi:hypothetical protein
MVFFSFITNIFEDGQNNLWLRINNPVSPGYLLQRFDVKTGIFFSFKMSSKEKADIPSDNISGICSDKEGRVWIATENGIFTYNYTTNKFNGYLVSPDTSKKNVFFNLYEPPSEPGILYMSAGLVSSQTFTPEGIVRYDIARDKTTSINTTFPIQTVFQIMSLLVFMKTVKNVFGSEQTTALYFSTGIKMFLPLSVMEIVTGIIRSYKGRYGWQILDNVQGTWARD